MPTRGKTRGYSSEGMCGGTGGAVLVRVGTNNAEKGESQPSLVSTGG